MQNPDVSMYRDTICSIRNRIDIIESCLDKVGVITGIEELDAAFQQIKTEISMKLMTTELRLVEVSTRMQTYANHVDRVYQRSQDTTRQ